MDLKKKEWAPYRRVASRLKRLLGEGPLLEGALSRVDLGTSFRNQLTWKENGRTKTQHVAPAAVEEIREWTSRWKETKALMKELNDCSSSILQSFVLKKPKAGGNTNTVSSVAPRRSNRTTLKR